MLQVFVRTDEGGETFECGGSPKSFVRSLEELPSRTTKVLDDRKIRQPIHPSRAKKSADQSASAAPFLWPALPARIRRRRSPLDPFAAPTGSDCECSTAMDASSDARIPGFSPTMGR